jgi:hypothetical protein
MPDVKSPLYFERQFQLLLGDRLTGNACNLSTSLRFRAGVAFDTKQSKDGK